MSDAVRRVFKADLAQSAWQSEPERLALVLDPARFELLVREASTWAERITLCVTAPESARNRLAWWQELFARSSKFERVYLRRAEHTDNWLLHRLHETGALRLVHRGGKQVAGNLLMFARSDELRVLFSHIPLERAVEGAAFGALLSFRGAPSGELGRACRAQVDSWERLARIPMGSEIDALGAEAQRREPLPQIVLPNQLRVISEASELAAAVERFIALGLDSAELEGNCGASTRAFNGGFRVQLSREQARSKLVLTLHAGAAWAAGNTLMLETKSGEMVLAWRGGLLGQSRSKLELLWSEARLPTFMLEEGALAGAQRVALVAHTGAPLGPQLTTFLRETCRLGEVFGVEPPPVLGHAVAEFNSLSSKQQTLLLWRALIGLGPLDFEAAMSLAAQALRDQGYLRGVGSGGSGESSKIAYAAIAELLAQAAEHGRSFDRPELGKIRAIQPDLSAYLLDDWQECLLMGLPETESVSRRRALRLGFERARSHFGLRESSLRPKGQVERVLDAALASGLRRGLFARAGAGKVQRLPSQPARAFRLGQSEAGFLAGWADALAELAPVQRFVLERRAGWHCRRETLESVAQRLGLGLERAQKLELEAWHQVQGSSDWARTLRERLERALGGGRSLPLVLLVAEDAWWRGVEQQLGLAEAVFEALLGSEFHRVELGPPGARETLFARFSQVELERTIEQLCERARQVPVPATLDDHRRLAALSAQELDEDLYEPLCDVLEAQLELAPDDPAKVLGWAGAGGTLTHLPEPHGIDSEARLRLEDAVRSAFRSAKTPLSLAAVAERVHRHVDVSDDALAVLLAHAPFVQRNSDQYGLLARDVPGGHQAIASALDALTEHLERSRRALGLNDAFALVQQRVKQPWSLELVRSLISSDPALCISSTRDVRLRRWEHTRLVASSELLCPGIPPAARQRFERLAQAPALDGSELVRQLGLRLERLEQNPEADDFFALALARHLCDLYPRLIDHTATRSLDAQRLARAALGFFLESTADDEDELDAPGLDRERLLEARTVLEAVLAQLELDWL